MKTIFVLLLVLVLVFAGYRYSFRRLSSSFLPWFGLTGTEFLFLGVLLGPAFSGVLDEPTTQGLIPLSGSVLGWVGLLYGFQFELAKLRRFPGEFLWAALIISGITMAVMGAAGYWGMGFLGGVSPSWKTSAALVLAATAAASAQTGLALAPAWLAPRRQGLVTLLRYISGLDGAAALAVFCLIFLFAPAPPCPASGIPGLPGVAILSGMGFILVFTLLLNRRQPSDEMLMVVIAMVLLLGGMASLAGFSPLVLNFLAGLWLVNVSRHKERIYRRLAGVEKPFYLLLLVFLGAAWKISSPWIFAVAAGYWLLRFLAKGAGGALATRLPGLGDQPRSLGLGLLEQGGLAMAFLLEFHHAFPPALTEPVLGVVLLAAMADDLVNPWLLNRLLGRVSA
ncbi:MAG: cation:proton antiporter [Proteobacteria bacterium]|nr:cation:proton antiporter [Pseudomonadota bacterium]